MSTDRLLPRYDTSQSYEWNYKHAPGDAPPKVAIPVLDWPGDWEFLGRPVTAPLAVAAGPLLNSGWVGYYGKLGFDVLTYKTVRGKARRCYDLPNLQPVESAPLSAAGSSLKAVDQMEGNWAVSFGMPSQPVDVWTHDVALAKRMLQSHQRLAVSVVATPDEGASLEAIAEDYANCCHLAGAAGADLIELNLSCPNVQTRDGQLYLQSTAAALVVQQARSAVPDIPLLAKVGLLPSAEAIQKLLDATAPSIDGLAMVNCISATVTAPSGPLFEGQPRGIAGPAIHEAAVRQVADTRRQIDRSGAAIELIGCGGVLTLPDVQRFLDAGANMVQIASGIMSDPAIALRLRQEAHSA